MPTPDNHHNLDVGDLFAEDRIRTDFKLAYLLSVRKIESTLVLSVTAYLLGVGFILGTGTNHNYELIYQFAHPYFWFALFTTYATVKLISIVRNISHRVSSINSVMGLWAWVYLFLSFAVFDNTAMAPTEAMLLVPVLAETWLMLSYQHNKRRGV